METPGHSFSDVNFIFTSQWLYFTMFPSFQLTLDKCKRLLIQALCNILMKCKVTHYRIVTLPEVCTEAKENANEDSEGNIRSTADDEMQREDPNTAVYIISSITNRIALYHTLLLQHNVQPEHRELSPKEFHERLGVLNFESIEQVEKYYTENFNALSGPYGVLLFMYTVLLTKVRPILPIIPKNNTYS